MTQTQPSTHAVEAVKACNRIVDVTPESIHRTRIIQSAIDAATAELRKERDEAIALLRECEWGNHHPVSDLCPICDEASNRGHKPDCRLAKALKGEQ